MFSGIVESVQPILSVHEAPGAIRISVQKPSEFTDIRIGDSIAMNGVCLTVEAFNDTEVQFALGVETLKVLALQSAKPSELLGKRVNLERSLKFGDRIHGHLVSGHVEGLGVVTKSEASGASWLLEVQAPESLLPYIWKKGSLTIHGVSLTVNEIKNSAIAVCLIPETLKRTNLGQLKIGDKVNLEPDFMARAVLRGIETGWLQHGSV